MPTGTPVPPPPYPTLPVGQTSFVNLTLENTAEADTLDPATLTSLSEHPFTVTDSLPAGFQFAGSDEVNNCTATSTSDPIGTQVVTCQPDVVVPGNHGIPGNNGRYTSSCGSFRTRRRRRPSRTSPATSKYGGDITPGDDASSDSIHVGCPAPGRNSGLCLSRPTVSRRPCSTRGRRSCTR